MLMLVSKYVQKYVAHCMVHLILEDTFFYAIESLWAFAVELDFTLRINDSINIELFIF